MNSLHEKMSLFLIFALLIPKISCFKVKCNPANNGCLSHYTFTKPLKWCTINSKENLECLRLIDVASTLGYHSVECVGRLSKASCLEAIKNNEADIVAVVNLPLGEYLNEVATTSSDSNPVDLTTVKDTSCVFKVYYDEPEDLIKGDYLKRETWKCSPENYLKVLCSKNDPLHCNYVNEIVMRDNDPNAGTVQGLLVNLWLEQEFFQFIFQGYTKDLFGMTEIPSGDVPVSLVLGIMSIVLALIGVAIALIRRGLCKK